MIVLEILVFQDKWKELIVLIFFHFAINISMVIGIFPSVGIPLPFISYGGSSMLAFTILFAGYIKIDSNKKEKW